MIIARATALAAAMLVGVGAGCATRDRLSTTQADALQVRVIDAGPDATFSAACGAVMDSGYVVGVQEGRLRVLSATYRRDPSVAEHAGMMALSLLVTGGNAMVPAPPSYRSVAMQVLAAGPSRSSVRIRTFHNGVPEHDAAVVQDLWVQMERRLLLPPSSAQSPPRTAPPAQSPPETPLPPAPNGTASTVGTPLRPAAYRPRD